ncbi:hsp90-like protein [Xylariomycetidae sp. FL2044]|nr:hsp90-like protein [Xylariomycetidae sp. FL2044]
MAVTSEAVRERETFKHAATQLAGIRYLQQPALPQTDSLRVSTDTVLTALIQLAALRLNATRALISLFDRHWQYVIAEATPYLPLTLESTTSLDDDGSHPEQRLLLCGTAMPRSHSICEHVLVGDGDATSAPGPNPLPISTIRDLEQHPRTSGISYIKEWPHRFHAGIPIRTSKGVNIGVLSVFSDDSETHLKTTSIHLMQDLSRTITKYLEAHRAREGHRRADRMVRGIGSFVEGEASLSSWAEGPNADSFQDSTTWEGSLNTKQQIVQQYAPGNNNTDPTEPPPRSARQSQADHQQPKDIPNPSRAEDKNPPLCSAQHIFSKAANVVRESIEVEGVLFLDAAISSFGGDISRWDDDPGSSSASSEEKDDKVEYCQVLGFSNSAISSIDGDASALGHTTVPERLLAKLLRRYPRGKLFHYDGNGSLQSDDSSSSGEEPRSASRHGSSSTRPSKPKLDRQHRSFTRDQDGENIISMFPGARSVVLVPAWDTHNKRWFAGGFAWTKNPTRSFSLEGELSYLTAFSSIIMAEIHSANEALIHKSKTDLLGSISHELRSPLHGVVLGSELLQDTDLDVFQRDVLNSMENCSRTLIDTIDHLLDWTKINKFKSMAGSPRTRSKGVRRDTDDGPSASIESGMISVTSDVDVDVVAEQVVESAFAGHSFQALSATRMSDESSTNQPDADPMNRLDSISAFEYMGLQSEKPSDAQFSISKVVVSLRINREPSWDFSTQAGAIRRIILNLVGNALKFTTRGFVKVSLEQDTTRTGVSSHMRMIHLTVSDSGRGIQDDFMRQHLFRAFSQEDTLTSGTGLGLSLVHKIVSELRGTIRVESEVDKGTTVFVQLPLKVASPSSMPTSKIEYQDEFHAQVQELRGLRVAIKGLSSDDGQEAIDDQLTRAMSDELEVLAGVCRDWLSMEIVEPDGAGGLFPDLILCGGPFLDKLPREVRDDSSTPTVVICRSALTARRLATSPRASTRRGVGVLEFASQPLGPRKLAKILLLCFKRWLKLQTSLVSDRRSYLTSKRHSRSDATDQIRDLSEPKQSVNGGSPSVKDERGDATPTPAMAARQDRSQTVTGSQPGSPQPLVLRSLTEKHSPVTVTVNLDPAYLLVDDNAINLKILGAYMKKLGLKYDTASNGLEAFELFKKSQGRYRYILMDISMPIMDGFEATRKIRSFERDQQFPRCSVFALTGLASGSAQQEAFTSGIDLFLTKPVKLKELSQVLDKNKKSEVAANS